MKKYLLVFLGLIFFSINAFSYDSGDIVFRSENSAKGYPDYVVFKLVLLDAKGHETGAFIQTNTLSPTGNQLFTKWALNNQPANFNVYMKSMMGGTGNFKKCLSKGYYNPQDRAISIGGYAHVNPTWQTLTVGCTVYR